MDRTEYYKQYYKKRSAETEWMAKKRIKNKEIHRQKMIKLRARAKKNGDKIRAGQVRVEDIPAYDGPPREELNKLWNVYRNYSGIAKHLGVKLSKIQEWLGLAKYMRNPGRVYREPYGGTSGRVKPPTSGRKRSVDKKAIDKRKRI